MELSAINVERKRVALWSRSDGRFMSEAIGEAQRALEKREVPVGAVVVCDGEVVGRGHNMREGTGDPTSHAEIVAIREAARRRGGVASGRCDPLCDARAVHHVQGGNTPVTHPHTGLRLLRSKRWSVRLTV